MDYKVISTGSLGNAIIINEIMLIDCGVTYKALKDFSSKFKIVLLTHIHGDHFNKATIKRLAFDRPTLRFATCEWLVNDLVACGVSKANIDVLQLGKWHDYKLFKLMPIWLKHNVQNCGYHVFFGEDKLFYATDTNSLDVIDAKDYNLYMVESNYTDEELLQRISEKQIAGEYIYEYEVMKNHLSKEKADNFIYRNIGTSGEYVYLHGHE